MLVPLILTRCPACRKRLGLNGTMLEDALIVCVSCGSHLRVEMAARLHLTAVDARLSQTSDSQPESYG
jgi:acetyl-CoA carboxylase beta subunit